MKKGENAEASATKVAKKVKSIKKLPKTFEEMGASDKCATMLRLMNYTPESLVQKVRLRSIWHGFRDEENRYFIDEVVMTDKDKDYHMRQSVELDISFVKPYVNDDAYDKKKEFLEVAKRAGLWMVDYAQAIFEEIDGLLAKPEIYDDLEITSLDPERLADRIFEGLTGAEKDDFYIIRQLYCKWEKEFRESSENEDLIIRRLQGKYAQFKSKEQGYQNLKNALLGLTGKKKVNEFLTWIKASLVRAAE